MENIIRLVKPDDAAHILKIYAPYIEETAVTFEYDTPSISEFTNRIKEISYEYPFLVYAIDEKIAGYAYARRHKERAGYMWNAELTIYVDKPYFRMGIGKALYIALIGILKMQHVENVYAVISSPNRASERLHEDMGFTKAGFYSKSGYKLGQWRDVIVFEKNIGQHDEPEPFIPMAQINVSEIQTFLNKFNGKNS